MTQLEIIPAEVAGFCDLTAGECVTDEGTPNDSAPVAGDAADGRADTDSRPSPEIVEPEESREPR